MRLAERPLTFEQEYPKHAFAPLVELAVAVAAWAVKRRHIGSAESAGPRARPVAAGPSPSRHAARHAAMAVTVTLALVAISSHVCADASSPAKSDSILAAAGKRAPSAAVATIPQALASVIAHYQADGLDTYAQDLRAFGGSATLPMTVFDTCTGSRARGSMPGSGQGAAVSATRASLSAVALHIDPPAARKLFLSAEFNVKDGLDVYDTDLGAKTKALLATSRP